MIDLYQEMAPEIRASYKAMILQPMDLGTLLLEIDRCHSQEKNCVIDNLLVQIQNIIVMIRWTGLSPPLPHPSWLSHFSRVFKLGVLYSTNTSTLLYIKKSSTLERESAQAQQIGERK